jgi:uncharacterized Zn finger protein (UPF0148 family)
MDANYTVKRQALTGAARVHFGCPACKAPVIFDLTDAGKSEPCPACNVPLFVPGEREKKAAMDEKQRTAQAQVEKDRERAAREMERRERENDEAALRLEEVKATRERAEELARRRPIDGVTNAVELEQVIARGIIRAGIMLFVYALVLLLLVAIVSFALGFFGVFARR